MNMPTSTLSSPAALALAAALAGALGCDSTPAARAVPTVLRGPKRDVMLQIATALKKGGHTCMVDEDVDLTCDAEKRTSVIISYKTGTGGLHLRFMSGAKWQKHDPCAEIGVKMNQFNDN